MMHPTKMKLLPLFILQLWLIRTPLIPLMLSCLKILVPNTSSSLSFMRGVLLPIYVTSEWSFAQFHLPETTRYKTAFGTQNTVMVIGMDGRLVDTRGQMSSLSFQKVFLSHHCPLCNTLRCCIQLLVQ